MSVRLFTESSLTSYPAGSIVWEGSLSVNGDVLVFPAGAGKISQCLLFLQVSSGSAKLQLTISPRENVIAGNAKWQDWDGGAVAVSTPDIVGGVTAIKLVIVSGVSVLYARGI